jgi:hypothetical protein
MSGKPFNMVAPADYRFWELLNNVVQAEPTDAIDATTLGFWASIGIMTAISACSLSRALPHHGRSVRNQRACQSVLR